MTTTPLPPLPDEDVLIADGHDEYGYATYQQGMEHLASEAIDTVARHGGSVEIEAAIRALPSQQDHIADVNKMVDRHTLQAQGKHPAPCARFCEANAFRAEARELTRLAQPITSLTITERARLLTAADHLEGDGHFMDCAEAEWAARWLRGIVTKGEPPCSPS